MIEIRTVIFLGPTLLSVGQQSEPWAGAGIGLLLPANAGAVEVRGPARCGDVYRAVQEGFTRIALIDGLFDQSLAVWHKEILWALHRGCAVLGAASMGALRAAELHPFGMVGVGRVFEAYRDGLLLDDDEVAVVHAGPADGYRPQSEALVNMRVTLQAAMAAGVMSRASAEAMVALAKARFYPERSWPQLLADAKHHEALAAHVPALRQWLGGGFEGAVNQKASDARALLQELGSAPDVGPASRPAEGAVRAPRFAFAYTEAFAELVRRHRKGPDGNAP